MCVRVAIIADASFCPSTNLTGWGCSIKADNFPQITRGGQLGRKADTSEAEAWALARAFQVAREVGVLRLYTRTLVHSDSLIVLSNLRRHIPWAADLPAQDQREGVPVGVSTRPLTDDFEAALASIKATVVELELPLVIRHVRSHWSGRAKTTGLGRAHDLCDQLARKGLAAARREHGEAA